MLLIIAVVGVLGLLGLYVLALYVARRGRFLHRIRRLEDAVLALALGSQPGDPKAYSRQPQPRDRAIPALDELACASVSGLPRGAVASLLGEQLRSNFRRGVRRTPVLLIQRSPPGAGFFSNFLNVLDWLAVADRCCWEPVVDMERAPTLFNEDVPVGGTTNAWEYYFEQPSGRGVADLTAEDLVITTCGVRRGEFSGAMPIGDGVSVRAAQSLVQRYIRLADDVLATADGILHSGVHADVLGVHVRGTDMRQGLYPDHPQTAPPKVYLERTQAAVERDGFRSVFLACDEIETIHLFQAAFGAMLLTTDAYRVSALVQTTTDYEWLVRSDRTLHRYQLGREVLVDAILLSRCGTLICSQSNVPQAAMYLARGYQEIDFVPAVSG